MGSLPSLLSPPFYDQQVQKEFRCLVFFPFTPELQHSCPYLPLVLAREEVGRILYQDCFRSGKKRRGHQGRFDFVPRGNTAVKLLQIECSSFRRDKEVEERFTSRMHLVVIAVEE